MSAQVVSLWRCVHCGKWSHARRMPKKHQRWRPDSRAEQGEVIIDPGTAVIDPDDDSEPMALVECGPFSAWTATSSETVS